MNGTEVEPNMIAVVNDLDDVSENKVDIDARQAEIKDFKKRSKKAALVITQTMVLLRA